MTAFDRLHPAVQHHIVNSLGWANLRPMQLRAIEPILAGAHVLVLAPTAGGKTEAAVLPLLSAMLEERWAGLSVLFVCPIKALLNNLEPRLTHLAGLVGRRAAVWHGDIGPAERRRLQAEPPDLLLTTPESLEAMLISARVDHAGLFGTAKAIVVDELHAFAADDRGWHLLALLERLGRLAGRPLQRIGLSATVGNPEALLDWLAGHVPGERRVLAPEAAGGGGAATEIKLDAVGSLENAALVIARLHPGEKRLVFCDSRSRTEDLAAHLRGHGVRTFVSHSSLSQDERRQAEAAFAEGSNCVIVATSTLELGIDVGDLDRVIQIDAPSTVAAFLQRLGRTGRRTGTRRNCLFLTTSPDAFLRAAGIVLLWSEGFVEPVLPPPLPWHLFAQQIMALCLQEERLAFDAWRDWICCLPAFFGPLAEEILSHMRTNLMLVEEGGVLSVGPEGERQFGRRHFLDLVAAFSTSPLFLVRHGRQELGQVHALSFRDDRPSVLLLGGRSWVVTGLDWQARIAWVQPSIEPGRSRWEGSSRAMEASLCRAIRRVLAGAEVSSWLSKRGHVLLDALRDERAWCRDGHTALVRDADGKQRWWTFAGLGANAVLAAALDQSGVPVLRHDNLSIVPAVAIEGPDLLKRLREANLETVTPLLPPGVLDDLKFGPCLPPRLLQEIVTARLADRTAAAMATEEPLTIATESG